MKRESRWSCFPYLRGSRRWRGTGSPRFAPAGWTGSPGLQNHVGEDLKWWKRGFDPLTEKLTSTNLAGDPPQKSVWDVRYLPPDLVSWFFWKQSLVGCFFLFWIAKWKSQPKRRPSYLVVEKGGAERERQILQTKRCWVFGSASVWRGALAIVTSSWEGTPSKPKLE